MTPRPYQDHTINQIYNKPGDVLLASCMGSGKTFMAIRSANKLNVKKLLVICPASLVINWQREIHKFSLYPMDVTIISHQSNPPSSTFDLIIVDEAHRFKNPTSIRSKRIFQRPERIIYLTGTPITNQPVDLWNFIARYDPHTYDNYDFFKRHFLNEGLPVLKKDLNELMIVHKKEDVLKDLPELQRQIIIIPGQENHTDKDIQLLEDVLSNPVRLTQPNLNLSRLNNIRKQTAIKKIPYLKDLYKENQEQIIIFAHHKEVIQKLNLKNAVYCTGEMSKKDRQSSIDSFQSGNAQYFIASMMAASEGITLTNAHIVDFLEIDWLPSTIEQAEARAHRIGQKSKVLSRIFLVNDSIDYRIYNKMIDRSQVISNFL